MGFTIKMRCYKLNFTADCKRNYEKELHGIPVTKHYILQSNSTMPINDLNTHNILRVFLKA